MSQSTYECVKKHFLFRLIDCVAVRGKEESTFLYELVLNLSPDILETYNQAFKKAFEIYRAGKWKESLALFETLAQTFPDDRVTKVFIERCHFLIENAPDQWCGVWKMV